MSEIHLPEKIRISLWSRQTECSFKLHVLWDWATIGPYGKTVLLSSKNSMTHISGKFFVNGKSSLLSFKSSSKSLATNCDFAAVDRFRAPMAQLWWHSLGALQHLQRLVIRQWVVVWVWPAPFIFETTDCEVKRASISEISAVISQLVSLTTLHYITMKIKILSIKLLFMACWGAAQLKTPFLEIGTKIWYSPDGYFCPTEACGHDPGLYTFRKEKSGEEKTQYVE